jgi:putative ABC transport system permease protein
MRQELRISLRRLARNPLVSLTVILTLTVGIGAVTTAFTIVRGVLSPLDYPQPERLVRLWGTLEELKSSPNPRLAAIWNRLPVSYRDTVDWRRQSRALRSIGLFLDDDVVLEPGGEPLDVPAAKIDADLLQVLGVEPALGRRFSAQEMQNGEQVALLAHELWMGVFGSDPQILGRAIRIDGKPYTVIGVMPPSFGLPESKALLWTPAAPTADDLTFRDQHNYTAIARLAPGVRLEAAQAETAHIAADLGRAYPDTNAGTGIRLAPLLDTVVGDSRRVLSLLTAATVAVLLIACLNLALVLIAQGAERRGETALRLALGARRSHLLRQSAVEILILAVLGSAGGLLLAALARRALPLLLATELPRMKKIAVDGRAALFALGAGLAAALLGGLAPAVLAASGSLRTAIAERRSIRFLQDVLVVVEVALTLVLTAGALILASSWLRSSAVDPGFDAGDVLVQQIRLPAWQYPDEARRGAFAARLLTALTALPGARGAALASRLPVHEPTLVFAFRIAGTDAPGGNWTLRRSAFMQHVTPDYFRLLRIPVIAGRAFDSPSGTEPGRVVMVSRSLAEKHWPGRSPVGAKVILREQEYQVIGVFADIKHQGLVEDPGELMIQPWDQGPTPDLAALVRFDRRPLASAAAVRRIIRSLDPALPLPPATRLEDVVARSVLGPRARALLLGLSAGVALLLALVGTYGVMAYRVSRQRRDLAMRMVAGADRRAVHRWVLRRALSLALAGVALGLLGALAAGRLLAGLLFGAAATDARSLGGAALLLLATCLAAAYLPARRASRVEPAAILRSE